MRAPYNIYACPTGKTALSCTKSALFAPQKAFSGLRRGFFSSFCARPDGENTPKGDPGSGMRSAGI